MKRIITLLLVLALALSLFAGCGSSDTSSDASTGSTGSDSSASAEEIVIKVGHPNPGTEYDQYQYYLQTMSDKLEELSGGTMRLEIYSDGTLGSERDMFESVMMGTLDMAFNATVTLSSSITPLQIFDMPYLFDNEAEFRALFSDEQGLFDDVYATLEEDWNMHCLGFAEGGFRRLMGKDDPMTSIESIAGKKIRIADNVITSRIYTLLGGIPTNIAWSEVFTAHQQGTIDAGEWPLFSAYSSGFDEVTDWYVFSDIYAMILILNINQDLWDSFSEEQQAWMVEAEAVAKQAQFEMIDVKSEEFLAEFEANGCEVIRDFDKTPFIEATAVMWDEFRDDIGGDFIDAVNARLDEIRETL